MIFIIQKQSYHHKGKAIMNHATFASLVFRISIDTPLALFYTVSSTFFEFARRQGKGMNLSIKTGLLALSISIIFTGAAHAGLLNTDGAEPVEPNHVEVEINGSYMTDNSKRGSVTTRSRSTDGDISVTAGITKGLDIAFSLPYTFGSREKLNGELTSRTDGFNDMTVDLKFQFLDLDGLKLAIKPGIILPTGKSSEGLSDEKFGFAAALLATKEFHGGKSVLHANADYGRHNFKDDAVRDATRPDFFTFSIACEAEADESLKFAVEMGVASNSNKADNTPHAYGTVGAKYVIVKALEGYAGIKAGLTSPEADLAALFGLVLKF